MEFKLVYGRSGTGKSTYIYEDIKNKMKDNKIFVIRPTKHIKIKHMETNKNKIQAMYDLGVDDTKKKLNDLKKYLEK